MNVSMEYELVSVEDLIPWLASCRQDQVRQQSLGVSSVDILIATLENELSCARTWGYSLPKLLIGL